ncbi:alpha/beta-hydrolase [Ramaria rubella]|nr:alpha/beta-hydrolase [Ramaria rubella]
MTSFFPSLQTLAKGTFASAVGLSTLTAGLLYYGQNYLIYPSAFPPGSRTDVPRPSQFGMTYEDLMLDTVDGVKINCYFMQQRKELPGGTQPGLPSSSEETDEEFAARRPTVVMFHGNGGNAGHRLPLARVFYVQMRCNVLMLSYRGYGYSQGSPSEKGIRIDAQTALDYLTSHPILSPTKGGASGSKIFLYGQSIGGAVAVDLAARNPQSITGLILENTFLSIPRMIPAALPFLSPFAFLCHQKWDNATMITKIPASMALLMLSGKQDEIVPAAHMSELWDIAQKSGRKDATWVDFEFGHHNDTCMQSGYWAAVSSFISRLV